MLELIGFYVRWVIIAPLAIVYVGAMLIVALDAAREWARERGFED